MEHLQINERVILFPYIQQHILKANAGGHNGKSLSVLQTGLSTWKVFHSLQLEAPRMDD